MKSTRPALGAAGNSVLGRLWERAIGGREAVVSFVLPRGLVATGRAVNTGVEVGAGVGT